MPFLYDQGATIDQGQVFAAAELLEQLQLFIHQTLCGSIILGVETAYPLSRP